MYTLKLGYYKATIASAGYTIQLYYAMVSVWSFFQYPDSSVCYLLTYHRIIHYFFPSQTLKRFNDQINSLSSGELILEENLFAQLRDEFKKWNDHLNAQRHPVSIFSIWRNISVISLLLCFYNSSNENEKVSNSFHKKSSCFQTVPNSNAVSQENRGRNCLGFSNYKVFETVLQTHVAKLQEPANDLRSSMKGTSHNFVLKDVLNNFNHFSAMWLVCLLDWCISPEDLTIKHLLDVVNHCFPELPCP